MAPRENLQSLLESLLGSTHVYFQPPANVQMEYPCIVYQRDDQNTTFANNMPYTIVTKYMVTVIDRDPDSEIPGRVSRLRRCIFSRFYVVDNLNHDVFTLYF